MLKIVFPSDIFFKTKMVFADKNITDLSCSNFKNIDRLEISKSIIHKLSLLDSSYPLFSFNENNDHLNYVDNCNTLKELSHQLVFIENNYDVIYDNIYDNIHKDDLIHILSCIDTFNIFGDLIYELDYKKYGFFNSFQMYYSLSAYIFEYNNFKDNREPYFFNDNKTELFCFINNIHGDFRLSSYNLNHLTIVNPIDNLTYLPFTFLSLCKSNSINSYHSVEDEFIFSLLTYMKSQYEESEFIEKLNEISLKINDECIKTTSKNIFNYIKSNSVLNFDKSKYLMQNGRLPTEDNYGYYNFNIEFENFAYYFHNNEINKYKKVLDIDINTANKMLYSLLLKTFHGNGRISIHTLFHIIEVFTSNRFDLCQIVDNQYE